MNDQQDRIVGSILGLALGDALGAPFEGGPIERLLWALIGRTDGRRRWTDDTQMTLDVIESLLERGAVDQQDLAARFARSYRWSRGYGPGAAKILKRIAAGEGWRAAAERVYKGGSFGNGGAMRAPVIGLYYAGEQTDVLVTAARDAAAITHAHPLGLEGAAIIALGVAFATRDAPTAHIIEGIEPHVTGAEHGAKLAAAKALLDGQSLLPPRQLAKRLGNGIEAQNSCSTALYAGLAFRAEPFVDLVAYVRQVGGDVDTIGAMAGALWGACRGRAALPGDLLAQVERGEEIEALAVRFASAIDRP